MLLNFRATTSEHVNRLEQVISSVDAGCKNIVCSTSQSEHVEIPFKILFYSPFLREMVASVPLLNESQTVIMPDCSSASVIKHLVSLLSDGYTQISQTEENEATIIDVAKMLGFDLGNLSYDEATNKSSQIKNEPEEIEAQEMQANDEYYEDNIPEVKVEMKNENLKMSAFARAGSDIPNVIQNHCLKKIKSGLTSDIDHTNRSQRAKSATVTNTKNLTAEQRNKIVHECVEDQINCDFFLETELALNHKKKVHMIEPSNSYSSNWQLVCNACGKSIQQGHKWEIHKTTIHPYSCEEDKDPHTGCFMRFLTQTELTRHKNLRHKKRKSKQMKKQSLEVEVIACVPKIKKPASNPAVLREIPDPAPTMTPLALRAGSPLPSDQYWVCHTCLELFTSQAMYNKHEKVGEKIHKLPCEKFGCKNVMLTKAGALKHMWDVHQEKVKQVKYCGRCQDVVDVKSWTAHEKKDHDSMCGYAGCGAQMPTNKGLWLHMVKKHCYGRNMNPVEESEEEEYEMEDDDMSDFKYYEEIEQVVEADEGEFIKCKVCELLIRRGKIMAHSKKIHKFKCIDGCDLAFTQEHLMFNHCYVEHNNTEHISEKGYLVCPECSEFFESCLQRSYDLHTKTGIHLTCSKCELKFGKSKEDQFKFHQDFAHQAVSDVPCGTCDMVFTSSDTKLLERHRKEEHKVGPCPHCKEISKGNLLFVSKERFMKHHGLEHSLLTTLGCHCAEIINGDVKVHGDIKS